MSGWVQMSGANPENLVSIDLDGDGYDELMVDFGTVGLWILDSDVWSQINGLNPD